MPELPQSFLLCRGRYRRGCCPNPEATGLAVLVKGSEVVCERDGADDHAGGVDGLGDLGVEETVHVVEEPRMLPAPLRRFPC